jgi:hypothetical protein
VFNITLTDQFQHQSECVDTNNITERKNVQITDIPNVGIKHQSINQTSKTNGKFNGWQFVF